MKRISPAIYICLIVATLGCSKKAGDSPVITATKFPEPAWKADDTGKYPSTMTAVINLPAALSGDAGENDKLAAFINGECRGVGVIVKVKSKTFFLF